MFQNNQSEDAVPSKVIEYKVKNSFNSKLKDKNGYLQIDSVKPADRLEIRSLEIDGKKVGNYTTLEGIYYTNESGNFRGVTNLGDESFRYFYGKFALTGITIPLKFRGSIGNDTINPSNVETGVNINFAPSYRLNLSYYNPTKKLLGKDINNYSLTFGGLIGLGATNLKTASNAPGPIV